MSFDADVELILAAYETKDDIGKILRCYLVVEGQMQKLITTTTKAKIDDRTSFATKANLLRAMGVPDGVTTACSKLNQLRNEFAHAPKTSFIASKPACDAFLRAAEVVIPILPLAHGLFKSNKDVQVQYEFTYAHAEPGHKVVVASSFLSAVLGVLPKLYNFGTPTCIGKMSGLNL